MAKALARRIDRIARRLTDRAEFCPHSEAERWTERFKAHRPEYARFLESLKHRPESRNENHVGQTAANLCGASGIDWDGTKITEPANPTPEQTLARERCDKLMAMMSDYQRTTLDLFPIKCWGLRPRELEDTAP